MESIVSVYDLKDDAHTKTVITTGVDHVHIHDAITYVAHARFASLGDEAAGNVYFKTPASTVGIVHMVVTFSAELAGRWEIRESASVSLSGSTLTAYNKDRNSANTAGSTVRSSPTLTASGTFLDGEDVGGGSGPHAPGGPGITRPEWELKSATIYVFRLISEAASNSGVVRMEWYELVE